MFDTRVIAAKQEAVEAQYRDRLPAHGLFRYTVPQVDQWLDRLSDVHDDKRRPVRNLSREEEQFIFNEWLLCKIDNPYFLERYATVNVEGSGLSRLYPLWESQRLILRRMGEIEYDHWSSGYNEGVLVNVLKARQLGASSLSECILAHRLIFHPNVFGLVASDVPESSAFLFDMFERVIVNLPWYLRPGIVEHVKDEEMLLENDSHIWVGSGKSTRGVEGKRGQLGRGKTLSALHCSEMSTWEEASQVDGSLEPACPRSYRTFWVNESTAKGRQDWWHEHWLTSRDGLGRFRNIFVPWYAELHKYSMPAPVDWSPCQTTLSHAARCEDQGPRFMGRAVHLTRAQLYWYEQTRAKFERKEDLATFLEEYAADDEECFQFSGKGVFSLSVQQRIRDTMRPVLSVIEVLPNTYLADQSYANVAKGTEGTP